MSRILFILAVLFVGSVSVSADNVVLNSSQMALFSFNSGASVQSGNAPSFVNQSVSIAGRYTIAWDNTNTGLVIGTISQNIAALGITGDTFRLTIFNADEYPWNFAVSVNNGAQSSGPFLIPNGDSQTFSILLATSVTQVSVSVTAVLPINGARGPDRTAEFQLPGTGTPFGGPGTPEPSSMLLLGTGLIGVAVAVRRKLASQNH